jgi:hypothetical protein
METGGRTNGASNARQVVAASAIRTVIEWYAFALYGAASAQELAAIHLPGESRRGVVLHFDNTPVRSRDHWGSS